MIVEDNRRQASPATKDARDLIQPLQRTALMLWLVGSLACALGLAATQIATHDASGRIFGLFYRSVSAWLHGGDPYNVVLAASGALDLPNLNPPVWFMVFGPITALPVDRAALAWSALTVGATLASVALAERIGDRRPWLSWRGLALLAAPPLWDTLARGQVYPFVLLPLAAGWLLVHRGNWRAGALLLGLAIAFKPPLFVIALVLFVADRRLAIATALASGGWFFAPLVAVAPVSYLHWLETIRRAPVDLWLNSSWTALAIRWVGPLAGDGMLILVVVGAVLLSRRIRDPEAAIAAGVAASLLASPIVWPGYFLLLIPGFLWLGRVAPPSRLLDLGLLIGTCPYAVQVFVPSVPIYATALTIWCYELARAAVSARGRSASLPRDDLS